MTFLKIGLLTLGKVYFYSLIIQLLYFNAFLDENKGTLWGCLTTKSGLGVFPLFYFFSSVSQMK